MAKQIVVQVQEWDAPTPEDAVLQAQQANSHLEWQPFVYAATTLDELPHPSQVSEISEAMGR